MEGSMRNLFPLLLVLVTSMAPAEEFKGWRILKGTVPQTELRVQPLDALKNIKLTFSLIKRGRRLDGAGEPVLSIQCRDGAPIGVGVWGTNSVDGPAGRVRVEARFDKADPQVTQWLLTGNVYGLIGELENKSFAAQFLISKQLDIILPLLPSVSRLGPSDVQMLVFDLDGFAEAATEMRKTCPF
jgi:hypothetical protein